MTKDRVLYIGTFQIGEKTWQKAGVEAQITDGDNIFDSLMELKKDVEDFHRKANPHLYPKGNEPIISEFIPYQQIRTEPIPDPQTDKEFAELKKKLSKFKSGQEALDYLSTTPFKHTIEAKQHIQNKFSNNGKQKTKQSTDSSSYTG